MLKGHVEMRRVILTCGTPIIERVTDQRQECVPDTAYAPAPARERSLVGPIVGGVAGGVLGNQVGRGSGRTATAAGAIAGTVIGDRVGNADSDRIATAPPPMMDI